LELANDNIGCKKLYLGPNRVMTPPKKENTHYALFEVWWIMYILCSLNYNYTRFKKKTVN